MNHENQYFKLIFQQNDGCENFIRVILKQGPSEYLMCGTNAYHPVCHTYNSEVSLHQKNFFFKTLFQIFTLQIYLNFFARDNTLLCV